MNPKDQQDADMEPEPTAEERAEAEALAQALEAGVAATAPSPDDALGAAALLRHARRAQDPGEPARAGARIAAAEGRALAAVDKRRPRRRWWLLPALLVPAGAAVALSVVATLPSRQETVVYFGSTQFVPRPPTTLLEAQAKAAHTGADLAALDRQMRDYREDYYAALGSGAQERP